MTAFLGKGNRKALYFWQSAYFKSAHVLGAYVKSAYVKSAYVKRLGCALALAALAVSVRAGLVGEETRLAFDVSTRINLN